VRQTSDFHRQVKCQKSNKRRTKTGRIRFIRRIPRILELVIRRENESVSTN
jgi:hypothetical protein